MAPYFKGALVYKTSDDLLNAINKITSPDILLIPASKNIRYRHVVKGDDHYYFLFNEEATEVKLKIELMKTGDRKPVAGNRLWIDPFSLKTILSKEGEMISFKPHEMKLLMISDEK